MSKKEGRFRKLELVPLLKGFRKSSSNELKRFEYLEVDGHKIEIEITHKVDADAKGFVTCPQCKKRNPESSLYCLYCSFIFSRVAREVPDTGLQPYQIQCPNCRRTGTRSQRSCVYCGQVFVQPDEPEIPTGAGWQNNNVAELCKSMAITVTIDGVEYHSTDPEMPPDIRQLMVKINHEGYTKEMVDVWAKNRQGERDVGLQWAQEEPRNPQAQLWIRIAQIVGVIGFFAVILLLAARR
ncbi:MAG: zinc ribbon domain-containing protein [Candidatus Omnitrophota bacterium]|jgi:hypothetical protein